MVLIHGDRWGAGVSLHASVHTYVHTHTHLLFKLAYKGPMQLVAEVLHSLVVMPQNDRGGVIRELALWLGVAAQSKNTASCSVMPDTLQGSTHNQVPCHRSEKKCVVCLHPDQVEVVPHPF